MHVHADARARDEVSTLLNGFGVETAERRARYVDEHLANRGQAARRVAEVLREVARRSPGGP